MKKMYLEVEVEENGRVRILVDGSTIYCHDDALIFSASEIAQEFFNENSQAFGDAVHQRFLEMQKVNTPDDRAERLRIAVEMVKAFITSPNPGRYGDSINDAFDIAERMIARSKQ